MRQRISSVFLVGLLLVSLMLFPCSKEVKAESFVGYPPNQGSGNFGPINGPIGSQCDLNIGSNKWWTSSRGPQDDDPTTLFGALRTFGSIRRFPKSDAPWAEFRNNSVVGVMPDGFRIYGATDNNEVYTSLKPIAPFYPTEKTYPDLGDKDFVMSITPRIYLEFAFWNNTDAVQSGQLLVGFDNAVGYNVVNGRQVIYYRSPQDQGAIRALATDLPGATWGIGTGLLNHFEGQGNLAGFGSRPDGVYNPGCFAIPFTIYPHTEWRRSLVYAFYNPNGSYFDQTINTWLYQGYTELYPNIEKVIDYAFANRDWNLQRTREYVAMRETGNSDLDFVNSVAEMSYKVQTAWLYDRKTGRWYYFVSEGDCRFLSTVDVGYETFLWELKYAPWAAKLQLDQWPSHYSGDRYGVFLEHDLGVNSVVTPKQTYQGCMGVEENINYTLMLFSYWQETKDPGAISGSSLFNIEKYMDSVVARDSNGNGLPDVNAYYTTFDYDGGHSSIGNAKENTYVGVKTFAALLAASYICKAGGHNQKADQYYREAVKSKDTLNAAYNVYGYLPVSLSADHPGWGDHSIVTFEGLIPFIIYGIEDPLIDQLLVVTAPSLYYAFQHCNRPYGYSLVSSSNITWLSKTFDAKLVNDYFVLKGFYSMEENVISKARALLQTSTMGWIDTWDVGNGQALCLKLYPRGVSSAALAYRLPDVVKFGYRQWLHRDPDPSGYNTYLGSLKNGSISVDRFTQILRHSQEYAEETPFYIGSKRCTGYVDWAFQYHFGYPQDSPGRQHFISLLTSWQWNDAQVFWEFYYANMVWEMYRELLFRDPDSGGYESNMNALKSGVPRSVLEDNIRNSPEYKQKH